MPGYHKVRFLNGKTAIALAAFACLAGDIARSLSCESGVAFPVCVESPNGARRWFYAGKVAGQEQAESFNAKEGK